MVNTEKEIWKPYPEHPFIEANQFGQIRTKNRYVMCKNGVKQFVKGRILKQYPNNGGYMRVSVSVNGKRMNLLVHRIVASAFIPNSDNLPEVNHSDNNPANNAVSNLEWCTSQYNTAYREKYGVSAKEVTKALRKPVIAVNLETLEVFYFESQNEASRQLGIDRRHVNNAIRGLRKTTGGYWFASADSNAIDKTRAKFGNELTNKVEELMSDELQLS